MNENYLLPPISFPHPSYSDCSPKAYSGEELTPMNRYKNSENYTMKKLESISSSDWDEKGRTFHKHVNLVQKNLNRLFKKFEFLLKSNNEIIKLMANFNKKISQIDEKMFNQTRKRNVLW